MHVHEWMTANPVTISPQTTCSHTFRLMREKNIHSLPVIDKQGCLAGIVAESDFVYSWPSSAALLSVHELDQALQKMQVENVMTRDVIWVLEDHPLEDAARILIDNKISSLPVMRSHRLVGIITKTDIFQAMMEALGGRAKGLRVTIRLGQDQGELGAITDGVIRLGGKLLGLSTFWSGDPLKQMVMLKLESIDPEKLLWMLEKTIGVQVIDYRNFSAKFEATPSQVEMEIFQKRHLDLNANPLTDST